METVKSEKVRKKKEERKPAASAADTGVSKDTGEKRRRSRRLSIKEELKDLLDDADMMMADGKDVANQFPVKEEIDFDELKSIKDEVV